MAKKVDSEREQARAAAEKAIRAAQELISGGDETAKTLPKLREALLDAKKRSPLPISVLSDDEPRLSSWNRQLVDPAIIELALSLDLPLQTKGNPRTWAFWLYRWAKRTPFEYDDLRRVSEHPYFGEVLIASFLPSRETKSEVGNFLARAVTMQHFARVFSALDELGDKLLDTWTVGALETHEEWIGHLCQPAVFAKCPRLARAIRKLSVARLMRNQLRAGLMDEWGHPAQEEALARFKKDRDLETAGAGPYPYNALFDKKEGRVVVYGPEGVVFDKAAPSVKGLDDVRQILFADGDVLLAQHNEPSQWVVAGGKPFKIDPYQFFDIGADGGVLTKSLQLFRKGDRALPKGKPAGVDAIWLDGERYFGVGEGSAVTAFDPRTGKKLAPELPRWMPPVIGDGKLIVESNATFTRPAPKGAEDSPIGAKNGVVGFVLVLRDGELTIEGVDGRRASGHVNGLTCAGLMTFPAREGLYRIVQSGHDLGIALPDGTTPLIQTDSLGHYFWAGSPYLPFTDWGMLRPRDLESSRALIACTDDAAKIIVDAAAALGEDDYEEPNAPPASLLEAVGRALPNVKHPQIAVGVAGIAARAAALAPIVTRLKSQVSALSAPQSDLTNDHVAAVSRLLQHERHWWVEKLGTRLGQQIHDAATFLFGEEIEDRFTTPAPSVVPWPALLGGMGAIMYRVLAPGTPIPKRDELRKFLSFWLETAFPDHLARLRLVTMTLPKNTEELAGLDSDHPQRLVRFENRYFLGLREHRDGQVVVRGIEAATDGTFRIPPGAVLDDAQAADTRFDRASIKRALALFDERSAAKFDPAIAKIIADKTGLSRAAATLVWSAGYEPWLLSEAKAERFGVSRDALVAAEREVSALPFDRIYARAMPADPAEVYDGATMAARLATAITDAAKTSS
jgi:hypothetical protein